MSEWDDHTSSKAINKHAAAGSQLSAQPFIEKVRSRLIDALSQSATNDKEFSSTEREEDYSRLEELRFLSLCKLYKTWEQICEKYGKSIKDDEVDLRKIGSNEVVTHKKRGRKRKAPLECQNPPEERDSPPSNDPVDTGSSNAENLGGATPIILPGGNFTPEVGRRRKKRRKSGLLFTRRGARSKTSVFRLKLSLMAGPGNCLESQELIFDDDAFENILS